MVACPACTLLFESPGPGAADAEPPTPTGQCGIFSGLDADFDTYLASGPTTRWFERDVPPLRGAGFLDIAPKNSGETPGLLAYLAPGSGTMSIDLGSHSSTSSLALAHVDTAQFHRSPDWRGVYQYRPEESPSVVLIDGSGSNGSLHRDQLEPVRLTIETTFNDDRLTVLFSLSDLNDANPVTFEGVEISEPPDPLPIGFHGQIFSAPVDGSIPVLKVTCP